MNADSAQATNPHYLDHVVCAAQSHEIEVAEDIVAGNGIKLLAKGARIDATTRDRLLQHKLRRPLENCVQVAGGAISARLAPIGDALLDKHPLMRALCASKNVRGAPASLAALSLSMPLQSLLTVYAQSHDERLDHAVGVAMLALSFARTLMPGDTDRHRVLATAGLLHDVGELYIDPAYLRKGTRLEAEQWRHIVTHPLVGHRVLRDMAGAGQEVANAVLLHHERLDGQGFPDGLRGEEIPLGARILAVLNDYDGLLSGRLYHRALDARQAMENLERGRGRRYDAHVVERFRAALQGESRRRATDVPCSSTTVRAGDVVARDLITQDGRLLLAAGHVLTEHMIEFLREYEAREHVKLLVHIGSRTAESA